MKITIQGQLFIDSNSDTGRMDVSIGKSNTNIEFTFPDQGRTGMLRIDRRELGKVLEILDQGLL